MAAEDSTPYFLIAGVLLVLLALGNNLLKRLPLSTSMLYLAVGVAIGPLGAGLVELDPLRDAGLLERITEIALVVSLFTAGLKLSPPLGDPSWRVPLRLAFVSMALTVALIALAGVALLGLSPGAAILLGAVLAPTDPVLASDVQLEEPTDRDRLRFGLTGEAGLNDGTAFPFAMLGLALLGLHDIGGHGWRWAVVDVAWATVGGLAIGGGLGTWVGRVVVWLRREHKEAVGLDDFLGLGLIALAYGTALACAAGGFLAVFAAGIALRRIERRAAGAVDQGGGSRGNPADAPRATLPRTDVARIDGVPALATAERAEIATHPTMAPAYMTQAVLAFNEQLERLGEVTVVVLLGAMLVEARLPAAALWFVPLLFLVVRPVSVAIGLLGSRTSVAQRALTSWFGIRGIGSVYYLAYAITHGVPAEVAEPLVALTLTTIAVSVLAHGVSVTPLMRWYDRPARARAAARPRER